VPEDVFRVVLHRLPDGTWRGEAAGVAEVVDGKADPPITAAGRTLRECVQALGLAVEAGPGEEDTGALELAGVAEAAAILGWDKRRVATYVRRGSFPEPVASLAGGRVWRRADVEAFAAAFRERQRRRHRRLGGAVPT
jgi:hypothetical protein